LHFLYDYAWFVGFFIAAATYYVLMVRYTSATNPIVNTTTVTTTE